MAKGASGCRTATYRRRRRRRRVNRFRRPPSSRRRGKQSTRCCRPAASFRASSFAFFFFFFSFPSQSFARVVAVVGAIPGRRGIGLVVHPSRVIHPVADEGIVSSVQFDWNRCAATIYAARRVRKPTTRGGEMSRRTFFVRTSFARL